MRKNYDSDRVREIFDLTLELAGIAPGTAKRSKSEAVFWDTILKLWKEKENVVGCNIMYASLYRLHWGCWLKNIESNMKARRLCEVVVKELQERKDILELIDRKRGFMTPWNAVMKSRTPFAVSGKRWKSEYYADFLKNRLDSSLYAVERFAEKLDLVNTKTYQFEEMKNHAMAKYRYERFMRLITKLIPESRCWSFEEWADENRIIDSLKLTMGIDFRNNWQQFDDVMRLLVWSENPSGYDRGMLSIRDVPFSVVKAIWPDNTEARVEELFMTACLDMRRHLQYEFTYANCVADNAYYLERQFIESWLYKQIKAWSHGDGYRLNHEIKKFLFDFEMGI